MPLENKAANGDQSNTCWVGGRASGKMRVGCNSLCNTGSTENLPISFWSKPFLEDELAKESEVVPGGRTVCLGSPEEDSAEMCSAPKGLYAVQNHPLHQIPAPRYHSNSHLIQYPSTSWDNPTSLSLQQELHGNGVTWKGCESAYI